MADWIVKELQEFVDKAAKEFNLKGLKEVKTMSEGYELELNPPEGKKFSLRDMSDFYDLTGINFRHYSALATAQMTLQRAQEGEIVPHGKSVEQLEEELLALSAGMNEWKANACLLYLRYRATNPGFDFGYRAGYGR